MSDGARAASATRRDTPAPLIRAAGAVVWRGAAADPEVALVHRPRYDDWSLPKGKVLDGEPLPLAAVREVQEETGLSVVLGRPLPAQGYFRGDQPKRVDYWAAHIDVESVFTPNAEVDGVEWLPVHHALRRLTYPRDADVVQAMMSPVTTTAYAILRHARAGSPQAWRSDDTLRPLDDAGRMQADILSRVLACYRPARVLTSPTTRCVETVKPYADAAGLEVETDPVFTVDSEWPAVVASVLHLLQAETPAVICGHGENLPSIVNWACVALGGAPPAESYLAKGAFWVLHAAAGALVGLEYHAV